MDVVTTEKKETTQHRSLWRDVWIQFRKHKGAIVGTFIFLFLILAVVVGPYIYTVDPTYLDVVNANQGPSLAHPLGTDNLGRDTLAQTLAGGRISLAVGMTAMLISMFLGTTVGILAGYYTRTKVRVRIFFVVLFFLRLSPLLWAGVLLFWAVVPEWYEGEMGWGVWLFINLVLLVLGGVVLGGVAMVLGRIVGGVVEYVLQRLRLPTSVPVHVDSFLMRLTDMFLALPLLPLLLVIIMLFRDTLRAVFGPEMGIFLLIVFVIGVTSWMQTARIVRGDVLSVKEQEYVTAAVSIGTRPWKIIMRHIFPNVLSPIMVSATLGVANAIITESALSFLGLGFPSDFPTWGRLLYDGANFIRLTPARVFWPGIAISLTVLSVNFIGDGLRDALDPRLRGR